MNEDINGIKIVLVLMTIVIILMTASDIDDWKKIKKQEIEIQELQKIVTSETIKELKKENKQLEKRNLKCHDYWEDRYNIRSQKDHEELLVYVDYYVRQKNIIEGMFDDKNLIQNIGNWQIDYGSLYEDACFGCGNYKKRHEFLLEEVKSQAGCNHCY